MSWSFLSQTRVHAVAYGNMNTLNSSSSGKGIFLCVPLLRSPNCQVPPSPIAPGHFPSSSVPGPQWLSDLVFT